MRKDVLMKLVKWMESSEFEVSLTVSGELLRFAKNNALMLGMDPFHTLNAEYSRDLI